MSTVFLLSSYRRAIRSYLRVLGIVLVAVAALSFVIPQTFTSKTSIMPPESKSGGGGLSSLLQ